MPNLTVSATIDAFMAAADAATARGAIGAEPSGAAAAALAAAQASSCQKASNLSDLANALTSRNNLGTKQNLSVSVASEAQFNAAIAAIEADASYNSGTIYVTGNITFVGTVPTTLTKDYTIVGTTPSAMNGIRPQIIKGNGAWLSMTGRRLIISNLRLTFSGPQVMFTMSGDTYASCYACEFIATAGGQYFKREYEGSLAVEFFACTVTMTNGTMIWIGEGNPGNANIPNLQALFVGCDMSGLILNAENAGKGRVVLVHSTLTNLGAGCWKATEFAAGRTDMAVYYNSNVAVSLALAAGSTDPITFIDTGLLPTQSTAVSATATAKNVRLTGSTAGQTLTLEAPVDGRGCRVFNQSSQSWNIATPSGTINGGAGPIVLAPGYSAQFAAFGTDWNT
jgi:hypothetical protein